jgi:hypothetical protein
MEEAMIFDKLSDIRYMRLASVIAAIRLESKGLKHSKGSVRKRWALHLGMGARAKHQDVIDRLRAEMDDLLKTRMEAL